MSLLSVLSILMLSPVSALRISPTSRTLSRRAAVGGFVGAAFSMVPFDASALTDLEQLEADETRLAKEQQAIQEIDKKISTLRDTRFMDELQEKKAEALSLDFLVKGDKTRARQLAEEATELAADEKKL